MCVCVCLLTTSNVSSSQSVALTFRSPRYVSMTPWMPRQFIASPKDSNTVSLFTLREYLLLTAETVTDVHTYWKGSVGGLAWHLNSHSGEEGCRKRHCNAFSIIIMGRSYSNACLSAVNCVSIAYSRLTQCSGIYCRGCAYWWLHALNGCRARKQCLRRWVWCFVTCFYCHALNSVLFRGLISTSYQTHADPLF